MKTVRYKSAVLATGASTTVATTAGDVVFVGTVATETLTRPAQQVTINEFPEANKRWARAFQLTSEACLCIKVGATSSVAFMVEAFGKIATLIVPTLSWTPPVVNTQPVAVASFVANGTTHHADYTAEFGSEFLPMAFTWYESDDGTFGAGHNTALSTGGIYTVSDDGTMATLVVKPANGDASKNGCYYRCKAVDSAAAPGTKYSNSVKLAVTAS